MLIVVICSYLASYLQNNFTCPILCLIIYDMAFVKSWTATWHSSSSAVNMSIRSNEKAIDGFNGLPGQ